MRTMTRAALIEEIRREVLALVDDEHSFCNVAGELGIGCTGFRQFTDAELAHRYRWIVKTRDPANLSLACVAATILPPAQAMSVTLVVAAFGVARV